MLLAFDLASFVPSLALRVAPAQIYDFSLRAMPHENAANLIIYVQDILARAGAHKKNIKTVAFTQGPGSFTGLRIGLAAAKGLALGLGVPLMGLPSVMAQRMAAQNDAAHIVLESRRQELFWFPPHVETPVLATASEIASATQNQAIAFYGDGAPHMAHYAHHTASHIGNHFPASAWIERAAALAPHDYVPQAFYGRAADAALPKAASKAAQ